MESNSRIKLTLSAKTAKAGIPSLLLCLCNAYMFSILTIYSLLYFFNIRHCDFINSTKHAYRTLDSTFWTIVAALTCGFFGFITQGIHYFSVNMHRMFGIENDIKKHSLASLLSYIAVFTQLPLIPIRCFNLVTASQPQAMNGTLANNGTLPRCNAQTPQFKEIELAVGTPYAALAFLFLVNHLLIRFVTARIPHLSLLLTAIIYTLNDYIGDVQANFYETMIKASNDGLTMPDYLVLSFIALGLIVVGFFRSTAVKEEYRANLNEKADNSSRNHKHCLRFWALYQHKLTLKIIAAVITAFIFYVYTLSVISTFNLMGLTKKNNVYSILAHSLIGALSSVGFFLNLYGPAKDRLKYLDSAHDQLLDEETESDTDPKPTNKFCFC